MPMYEVKPDGEGFGKAFATAVGEGMKVLKKKKAAKEKKEAYQPPEPSQITCPDCGKDQIEHDNGFVCACSVRKEIAK